MTYGQMCKKFGKVMAMDILMSLEKMAQIQTDAARLAMREEERLQTALIRLDDVCPIDEAETIKHAAG
ncbi:MAG: hypothetical protein GC131_07835 [Alphaproteobacteria bacterium]|nr:hypothetical protein [Alphaproteobacteria bacterium]